MRILIITSQITNSGGVSSILVKKANSLVHNFGCEVAIASTNDLNSEMFFKIDSRINLFFMKTKMDGVLKLAKLKNELRTFIINYKPDVVSVADNGLKSFFLKGFIGLSIPVVYEVHGNEQSFYNGDVMGVKARLHKLVLKQFLPKFDAVVIQNEMLKLPYSQQKVIYIPNFTNTVFGEFNVNSNKLVAVGRVVSTKNYEGLITIWKEIYLKYPHKELHIYGIWEDEYLVKKLLTTPNIYLHKAVLDQNKIYNDAYMLLHTSLIESFPMVFLEAMSYGLPIVCFNLNQPNIVLNNSTGYVVTANEYCAFTKRVISLLENKELAQCFSNNALNHISNFSEDKIIKQWYNLYKSLIN